MSKMETVSHDGPTLRQPIYGPRSRRRADHLLPTHATDGAFTATKKKKTPRLTAAHFTYISFAPSRRVCYLHFFLSGCSTSASLTVALDNRWMITELSKVLTSSRMS